MNNPTTQIIPYLNYENLFSSFKTKGGIILLDINEHVDSLIGDIIRDFDAIEAVSYSSFLNMVVQTCDAGKSLELGMREIRAAQLNNKSNIEGILFHRDNLLYLISQIIQKSNNGTRRITGVENRQNSGDYYKSLLLINSKLNKMDGDEIHVLLKDYLIREYPYYLIPKLHLIFIQEECSVIGIFIIIFSTTYPKNIKELLMKV